MASKITLKKSVWFLRRLDVVAPLISLDKLPVYVGSAPDNDLQIMEAGIDAYHARFEDSPDGLALFDLGSQMGTTVSGLSEKAVCFPPEKNSSWEIYFGTVPFELHYGTVNTTQNTSIPPAPSNYSPVSSSHTPPPPPPPPPSSSNFQSQTSYSLPPIQQNVIKADEGNKMPVGSMFSSSSTSKNKNNPEAVWYFEHEGREVGPLTAKQLFNEVKRGTVTPLDLVWKEGMVDGVLGKNVKGLFSEEQIAAFETSAEPTFEKTSQEPESKPTASSEPGPGLADSGHGSVTCPSCWFKFDPDDVLFISMHPDLIGDPVLGTDESKRFLPSRFNPEGLALDDYGMSCTDVACPRCHMRIPSQILSNLPVFLSIVGAPGSGKSHALAAAVWQLRTILPATFGYSFNDVDAVTNLWLNDYEQKLFFGDDTSATNTLKKTDENDGQTYKPVILDGMQIFLPKPCMFVVGPTGAQQTDKQCLVLYDNAGEHFGAGKDHVTQPGTKHLVRSEGVLFLYDPIGDPRMRSHLRKSGLDHFESRGTFRQDVLLIEMIDRIRRHAGLMKGELYDKPLVIALSKADLFGDLFDMSELPICPDPNSRKQALDLAKLAKASHKVRTVLSRFAPEVVNTVESFANQVLYLPLSGLGHNPDAENRLESDKLEPKWVELPFLYFLAKRGLIPSIRPETENAPVIPFELSGHILRFESPETGAIYEVPWHYSGYELECPQTGTPIFVPAVPQAPVI